MLIELMMFPFFFLLDLLVNLFPVISGQFDLDPNAIFDLFKIGMYFFGKRTFFIVLSNFLTWIAIDITWVAIEWAYKKIPGVN